MVKRTVQFTVKADGGVTPAIPLFGGVKGEHHATELAVTLESGVYTAGDVVRLSFTTGDGTVLSSDRIKDITNADNGGVCVTYSLPQLLTVAAGQLCARVVLSSMDNDKERNTWRSGEMVLYFEHADVENGTPFWTGVSEMLVRTVEAKDAAVEAMQFTEELSLAVVNIGQGASKAASNAYQSEKAAKDSEAKAADAAKQAQYAYDRLVNTLEYSGAGLTSAQIAALDGMFQIAAYTADATEEYAAFREAFGLYEPSEPDIPDHTHDYQLLEKPLATCTTKGLRTYYCDCGHGYTETIPATGHSYADGTCTKCGEADPDYTEPDVPDTPDEPSDLTAPVYQLASATTFDGTNAIDTGYKLLDTEKAWTVCVDFENVRDGTVWDASPNASKGLALSNRGSYFRTLYLAGSLYKDISGGKTGVNHKVIVTHAKNEDGIHYYFVVGDAAVETGDIAYTKYLTDTNIINTVTTVKLGCNFDMTDQNFKSTVNRFEIYERVITADEINAFLGVSE